MRAEPLPRWSHIGLCVRDVSSSMRFYCDGLGCEPAERYELDSDHLPGLGQALEVGEQATIVSQMITYGALRIELIEWSRPEPEGTLLPQTRQSPGIDLVFLADPDGTRIELMAAG